MAIRSYLRPELKFFPDNPETYKTIQGIFGGIRAVLGGRKTASERAEFRESFRVSGKER